MKFILSAIFIVCFYTPSSSWGYDLIQYKKPLSYKDFLVLSILETSANPAEDMRLAVVDLNNDFIDEYIVQSADCEKQNLCAYMIVAFMNKKPRIIGKFDAHQIEIADKKDYGVKQLIVYNEANNDFAVRTAFWRPYQFRYEY